MDRRNRDVKEMPAQIRDRVCGNYLPKPPVAPSASFQFRHVNCFLISMSNNMQGYSRRLKKAAERLKGSRSEAAVAKTQHAGNWYGWESSRDLSFCQKNANSAPHSHSKCCSGWLSVTPLNAAKWMYCAVMYLLYFITLHPFVLSQ